MERTIIRQIDDLLLKAAKQALGRRIKLKAFCDDFHGRRRFSYRHAKVWKSS